MLLIDTDAAGLIRLAMDFDDDLALLMALQEHVAAITITWGNAPAAMCRDAAKHLLTRIGRLDVPVYLGSECEWPWPHACPLPLASDASSAIGRLAAAHPKEITLVALGPLSNVAAALRDSSRLADDLKAIVIVGGLINPDANLAARLAANFYWLPDLWSAKMVFGSRIHKTLISVETMSSAFFELGDLVRLKDQCCPRAAVCDYVPAMLTKAKARVMDRLFPRQAAAVDALVPWDAVVMAFVQRPDLFSSGKLFATTHHWHGVTLTPTDDKANETSPFVVRVPSSVVNRSTATAHIASILCNMERHTYTESAVVTSSAIAWKNLPVALLNRGVYALEPIGVPSALLALFLATPLCFLLFLVPRSLSRRT